MRYSSEGWNEAPSNVLHRSRNVKIVQKFFWTPKKSSAEIPAVFFPLGDGVQHYESRIITPTGALTLISYGSFVSDFGAIRAAKSLCRDGELAEVWRSG
jgi:hypothetical protein